MVLAFSNLVEFTSDGMRTDSWEHLRPVRMITLWKSTAPMIIRTFEMLAGTHDRIIHDLLEQHATGREEPPLGDLRLTLLVNLERRWESD